MRVILVVLPGSEVLDFAGPLQVFHEANAHGGDYQLVVSGSEPELPTAQGLWLSRLQPLPAPRPGDLVLVPGGPAARQTTGAEGLLAWLRGAVAAGAEVCSICTGAFVLGAAGLLDGRECTTHWSRVEELARRFPRARVLDSRLFVTDGPVTTSAGIASGIDMALALVERHHGPRMASLAAREMVVYLRRDGSQRQQSVYLDHRGHLNQGVHRVQDWLATHPEARPQLAELARMAAMSVRSLTRQFRLATGMSVNDFATRVRLARARDLMSDSGLKLEVVAERCGFADVRHLRRLWRSAHGEALSAQRARTASRAVEQRA